MNLIKDTEMENILGLVKKYILVKLINAKCMGMVKLNVI